jgi:3-oxoacyl-[acyl-carrier protein] reductase
MGRHDHKRVVIVTGASRGLGREIALRFGRSGDRVVVNFLTREQDSAVVADEISRSGGEAVLFQADVRVAAEVDAMIEATVDRWGAADVLVNNAGLTRDGLLLRMSEQDWDDVLDTNVKGAFHCIRSASAIMTKKREGHIINISSIVGMQGREGQANYSASKAGLIGLTRAAAREFGSFNVKINAILPGYIPTDMAENISDAFLEQILKDNVLGRVSNPKEVAEFIFQLSLANNISGQVFNLDSRIF